MPNRKMKMYLIEYEYSKGGRGAKAAAGLTAWDAWKWIKSQPGGEHFTNGEDRCLGSARMVSSLVLS
jgi:hypothetical protein